MQIGTVIKHNYEIKLNRHEFDMLVILFSHVDLLCKYFEEQNIGCQDELSRFMTDMWAKTRDLRNEEES